jgi:DNA-binding SARP family transcriptional activator
VIRVLNFGVLGQLQVLDGQGGLLTVAAPRQRALLGVLLLNANRVVSAESLAESVWDGMPPRGAANTIRAYVMRLRKALGASVAARIETRDPGYLLRVETNEFDVAVFESLCEQIGAAVRMDGNWQSVLGKATRALRLWRGTPLIDVPSRTLRDAWVPRFEQQHLQLREWRIEAALELGRSDALIPEISGLINQQPLREPLYRLQMLALARAGRIGEALAVYREARAMLVDQLAIEPGFELKRLHQQLLEGRVPPPAAPVRQRPQTAAVDGAA